MTTTTQDKLTELLVDCPRCGRTGFTITGLRLHWCKQRTAPGADQGRLSAAEWQAAVARVQCAYAMERGQA